MAIDLPTIAKNYYGGTVSPDPSTLTSNYMTGWGFPYSQWSQDLKNQYAYNPTAAKQLLAAAGYPNGFKTDIVAVSSGDLDLLQIVKSYFSAVGIDMDIRTMDTASWTAFVQVGHKHDQLAIDGYNGQLGQTYEPPTQLSRFQTGYSVNWCMVSDPVFDAFYPAALSAPTADALKKVVADANLYIAQQHWSISLLQPLVVNLFEPWLKGFNGQFGQTTGAFEFQGFYIARFWIDSSLKKSLGY
jgi:ABC-type transport system substrate-binding protein